MHAIAVPSLRRPAIADELSSCLYAYIRLGLDQRTSISQVDSEHHDGFAFPNDIHQPIAVQVSFDN
jgi:hypothetical protein